VSPLHSKLREIVSVGAAGDPMQPRFALFVPGRVRALTRDFRGFSQKSKIESASIGENPRFEDLCGAKQMRIFWTSDAGRPPRRRCDFRKSQGFTLLEVLVALTVLALGAAITLSLISGSLGKIRKVQLRTRTVEHAESVMELALLDESIQRPTAFTGDFEDGTRWAVRVEEYEPPDSPQQQSRALPQNMPMKLLCYTVEMFSPDSRVSDYRLQTLKLVRVPAEDQPMGLPQ
jgi:prepilin-type N-terminal cleavage/methylation domain-containing protein